MHWSDSYVNIAYVPEMADCAVLAARVANDVLGKEITLPVSHAATIRAQARQVDELKDDYAVRVAAPIDGQPVLLIGRGQSCHIGVMCWIAHEWWVLHANQSFGFVTRERLRDLTRLHFKVEGFYQWL
ncbi:hypothetical protein ERD78_18915 [Allopusillimonas soli]|uniref:Uncharacterized protein n=2 Tax=Allopusillimonas soli TaxID=659016 RepID=A0A853FG58_9BURK|nr:hypothetical protein [Allopusillimonas soli]TEA70141.1 hypothetical protein ERD78_18915 [Allopusillimonas soli]